MFMVSTELPYLGGRTMAGMLFDIITPAAGGGDELLLGSALAAAPADSVADFLTHLKAAAMAFNAAERHLNATTAAVTTASQATRYRSPAKRAALRAALTRCRAAWRLWPPFAASCPTAP